ncbi:probable glutamate receptor [Palaemon carinicauda]|uniref:probable glutamate receptor n=1 Tax=Palaemon carinicauda TaxID=392227 RepID=UPI0035B61713
MFQQSFPIWGSVTVTCRTFLIDFTGGGDEEILRFLETNKFYEKPDSRVLMVGRKRKARSAIKNRTFRNNINTLYLGLQEGAIDRLISESRTSTVGERRISQDAHEFQAGVETREERGFEDRVSIYSGCPYCDDGQIKVLMQGSWSIGSKIPSKDISPIINEVKNLHGYLMRIISIAFTPYADYIQNKDGPGGIVTLLDSLDKRLIEIFAPVMNFSFVVKSPPDMSFGSRLPDGSWTGVHGAIYRKEADFTTSVGPSSQRLEIVEYERTVPVDQLIIVSLKPQPLPQYLVFLRPFTVGVWVCIVLAIMIWGTTFWLLQRVRSNFTGEEPITFNSAIFYSWTVILEDPPITTPDDISGQMLLCWWLIACFLLMSGFKSSLVAHLAIVAQSEPINTYRDLVTQSNWKWGIEDTLLTGMVIQYFSQNVDPDVRYIYKLNEKSSPAEGLKRVLEGRFSFLISKNRITTIIAQIYKKEVGETQFYLGKKGYTVASAMGWGVRRGAPFRPYLHKLISRLIASGIMDYLVEDVVHLKILQSKAEARRHQQQQQIMEAKQDDLLTAESEDGNPQVLRMVHMMGVFLVLVCGLTIASIIFCVERFIQRNSRHNEKRCSD